MMRVILVLGGLLGLLTMGCGRSPIGLDEDGGVVDQRIVREAAPLDGRYGETGPVLDAALPDAPVVSDGPCPPPSCVDRCKLLVGCGLFPKGPAACLAACPGWSKPTQSCLDALVCAGTKDCKQAATCITAPPVTDLVVKSFTGTPQGTTASYSFTVCNSGAAPAGPFAVDLYYNSVAPPAAGQAGDEVVPVLTGLGGNICAPFTVTRQNTPPGNYTSWLRIDTKNAVPEADENNNLGGPVKLGIAGPAAPDLVIKSFSAQAQGPDLVYDIEVCNQGTTAAWLFRLELYYNRLLPPSPYLLGDQNVMFLTGLAGGACKKVSRTYKNAPVGMYNSWALADSLGTVKESDESNNMAGPKLVVMSAQSGCISLCTFATTCGLFSATEIGQCLTWCNGMSSTTRKCADKAASKQSCSDLKACNLPPKPPPPAPPWSCFEICTYLMNQCQIIPQNQYLTCVGGCISLPQTKWQCALDAMDKKQCLQMSLCIF